ncbi:MAG: hypothetical protein ACXW4H_00400 [Candidatus Limnocylindrales bacterium]
MPGCGAQPGRDAGHAGAITALAGKVALKWVIAVGMAAFARHS